MVCFGDGFFKTIRIYFPSFPLLSRFITLVCKIFETSVWKSSFWQPVIKFGQTFDYGRQKFARDINLAGNMKILRIHSKLFSQRITAIFAWFFRISRVNINLIFELNLSSHLIKGLPLKNGCLVKWQTYLRRVQITNLILAT